MWFGWLFYEVYTPVAFLPLLLCYPFIKSIFRVRTCVKNEALASGEKSEEVPQTSVIQMTHIFPKIKIKVKKKIHDEQNTKILNKVRTSNICHAEPETEREDQLTVIWPLLLFTFYKPEKNQKGYITYAGHPTKPWKVMKLDSEFGSLPPKPTLELNQTCFPRINLGMKYHFLLDSISWYII